ERGAARAVDAARRAHAALPQPLRPRLAAAGAVGPGRGGRARLPRGHRAALPAPAVPLHADAPRRRGGAPDPTPPRPRPPRRRDGPGAEPRRVLRRPRPTCLPRPARGTARGRGLLSAKLRRLVRLP